MWSLFAPAILLGLVSSFHCVGMCGPLALSLPLPAGKGKWAALITYHAGRVTVYASLGAIFGILGRGIYLAGFQQTFSIVLGVIVLASAVMAGLSSWWGQLAWLNSIRQPLNKLVFRLWQSKDRYRYFVLGMANGLLPCGMVYLAIAGALSFSHIEESVLFMILFGAGTFPALLLLSSSRRLAGARTKQFIRRSMPGVVALMGVLLIFRGLDLGIPFLSPTLAHGPAHPLSCH